MASVLKYNIKQFMECRSSKNFFYRKSKKNVEMCKTFIILNTFGNHGKMSIVGVDQETSKYQDSDIQSLWLIFKL